MQRTGLVLAGLGILTLLCSSPALARGGHAHMLLGQKSFDEDAFGDADVDDPSVLGVAVTLDFDWPVSIAVDLLSSSDDSTIDVTGAFPRFIDTEVDTLELDLGVRRYWGDRLRWFTGGGLALVQLDGRQTESGNFGPGTDFTNTILDDDDTSLGLWLNGGVQYRLPRRIDLGVDLRYADAEGDLGSVSVDSSGFQLGALIGYRW